MAMGIRQIKSRPEFCQGGLIFTRDPKDPKPQSVEVSVTEVPVAATLRPSWPVTLTV